MSDPTFLMDDSRMGHGVDVPFREYRPPVFRYRNHQPPPEPISMHRPRASGTAPDTDQKPWVDLKPSDLAKGAENGRKARAAKSRKPKEFIFHPRNPRHQ